MEYIRLDILILILLLSFQFLFGKEKPLRKLYPILYLLFIILFIITNRNVHLCSFNHKGDTYDMYFNWFRSSNYFTDRKERYGENNFYTLKKNKKTLLVFQDKTLHEGNYRSFWINSVIDNHIYIGNAYETIIIPLDKEIKQKDISVLKNGKILSNEQVLDLIEIK